MARASLPIVPTDGRSIEFGPVMTYHSPTRLTSQAEKGAAGANKATVGPTSCRSVSSGSPRRLIFIDRQDAGPAKGWGIAHQVTLGV